MTRRAAALLLAGPLTLAGCMSELLPEEPPPITYLRVEVPGASLPAVGNGAGPPADLPALRLEPVQAAAHLRDKVVWREGAYLTGFYEERRWVHDPAAWVERSLAEALFEARGLRRAVHGTSPALQVTLVAFDEVRGPDRAALVSLRAVLVDGEGRSLLTEEVEVRRAVEGGEPEALAAAMSAALATASAELAERVVAALA